MRKLDLCFFLLSILLIPRQTAASDPHLDSLNTPTEKVCHVCEKEASESLADSAAMTPAPMIASATPSPSAACDECVLHADRIRAIATQAAREAASAENRGALIHILMFWMQSCPHCHDVLDNILPSLQQQYGDLLEILLIEIVTVEDVDELYQVAGEFGIAKDDTRLPFLIIGEEVLIGAEGIQTRLPRLIQGYLAEGGIELPQVPGLEALLERVSPQRFTLSIEITPSPRTSELFINLSSVDGAGLAVTTLIGMVAALMYAAASIHTAQRAAEIKVDLPWLAKAMPILALVGAAIAGYLAYIETHTIPAACGPVGDCNAVQSSQYAWVLGVMPVGLLGALGYIAILAAWLWGRFRDDRLARSAPVVIFGMTLFGVLFAIYLTFLEPFVIRAVCLWCLASSVIITLLFLLSLRTLLHALAIPKE